VPKLVDTDLLFVLHDVARLMRVRADQKARAHGMTRAQWVILVYVEMRSGISQNDLAGLVEVEPITIARLVDRLEARGLVERRHDPKDRRLRRLHLTPAAQPFLGMIETYRNDLRRNLTAGLDDDTLERMTRALLTMKENLLAEKRENAKAG
jgi:MarR family transcriptional regulator for hemolysin